MQEPGGLNALGTIARRAWNEHVAGTIGAALERTPTAAPFLLAAPDERTSSITGPDWTGLPARVATCLDRQRAVRLLDCRNEHVDGGGRRLQEEYLEWRVIGTGTQISRVELTTELSEYWRVLAAYAPEKLIETVAAFAREPTVQTEAVAYAAVS